MNAPEITAASRHERSDGSPPLVLLTAGGLLAGIGLVLFVSALLYHSRYHSLPATRDGGTEASFQHGPEARSGITRDWQEQDRLVREHLAGYGWVNRPAGVVRIPIERAMEIVAKQNPEGTK
jgi:hypothetical protein